jgi:hypothetical protein
MKEYKLQELNILAWTIGTKSSTSRGKWYLFNVGVFSPSYADMLLKW